MIFRARKGPTPEWIKAILRRREPQGNRAFLGLSDAEEDAIVSFSAGTFAENRSGAIAGIAYVGADVSCDA